MNPLILFVAFMLMRDVRAIVELDCSDNATCIDNMAKEIIRSVRQQRTVKVFDVLTIEPLQTRQARMARSTDSWLDAFLEGNAFSFDWNDYTFRVSQADDTNALDLEIYQGRTAKDVSDPNAKKSSSKNEEEKEEDKTPKLPGHRLGLRRRRQKKKVMQVIIPLIFGMKSAGVVMFAMAVVTVLTLKAFMASKVALLVTVGMAAKKLYETYGTGLPETSNVLWTVARYFRILFGLPAPPLNPAQTMTMPMFVMPQMYEPPVTMPPSQ
ncbi:uncharacterized protein LOC142983447 isoform X2 [Anticarsia gemmatalis]|uniref:uncharacterized protein LOC142983447 isoform X2 n=1 Tax=Anticarsia gemmatalis TaxID=129554 RepID=UPI003F77047B